MLLRSLLLAATFALTSSAHSHGRGLDEDGCHRNRKTGDQCSAEFNRLNFESIADPVD
jgi:hypothetical protein